MCWNYIKTNVRFRGIPTAEFVINKGLKQGDSISSVLFILVLESILRKAGLNQLNIITNVIQVAAYYADDITLISNSKKNLIKAIEQLKKEASELGQEIKGLMKFLALTTQK